ncbi:MAG: 50S ribosomal protein L6 [Pirellulales bacterium]|nr:50S ribosomal protein L6 [Pirellulales bacterium]
MSRIGKKPIELPAGVTVSIADREITVNGKLGSLKWTCHPDMTVTLDDQKKRVLCSRKEDTRQNRALHGLTRALIQNMVIGVSQGYEKRLEIQGVGYLGAIDKDILQLRVGFSNEVHKKIPPDLNVTCPDQTHIVVQGMDKQKVGQFAAEVRAIRKPEPYKGKGIRYEGEHVHHKAGKTAQ